MMQSPRTLSKIRFRSHETVFLLKYNFHSARIYNTTSIHQSNTLMCMRQCSACWDWHKIVPTRRNWPCHHYNNECHQVLTKFREIADCNGVPSNFNQISENHSEHAVRDSDKFPHVLTFIRVPNLPRQWDDANNHSDRPSIVICQVWKKNTRFTETPTQGDFFQADKTVIQVNVFYSISVQFIGKQLVTMPETAPQSVAVVDAAKKVIGRQFCLYMNAYLLKLHNSNGW